MKLIIFFIIIFQTIASTKCQYAPMARAFHTAVLIEKKIFFLGGLSLLPNNNNKFLNDFFFLDLSKSIDTTKQIPFIDLSVKASTLPPHYAAAASPYSEDSSFLFGGYVDGSVKNPSLAFSFNSTILEWNPVTVSQGITLDRETTMNAVTDKNNKIYIFAGGNNQSVPNSAPPATSYVYSTKMNIFDTVSSMWAISDSGLPGRDGHTATYLPDTKNIVYIGGFGIKDITNLDVYNTQINSWEKIPTKNPPESRYGHSAVLTNDGRIIVFGGSQATNTFIPVSTRYVVLDTKTSQWSIGTEDIPTRAPFRHHTATLYNDNMFIAFGLLDSGQASSDILIFKIGDGANFNLETSYSPFTTNTVSTSSTLSPTSTVSSTPSTGPTNSNNSGVVIKVFLGSTLGTITLGFIVFISFKWRKRTRIHKFEHALNT